MTLSMQPPVNFSRALDYIKEGHKVTRSGWNGWGKFIFLVDSSTFQASRPPLMGIFPAGTEISYRPHIDMCAADGTIGVWAPSMSDLMAEDWEILS